MMEIYKEDLAQLSNDYVQMPDPEPLIDVSIGFSEPFPVHLLPEIVRGAVIEYQKYGQQPIAIVAASAISAMSLACQGLANVARDDCLIGAISLNTLIVAESGERKTSVDSVFCRSFNTDSHKL